jgi:hypothetical protein
MGSVEGQPDTREGGPPRLQRRKGGVPQVLAQAVHPLAEEVQVTGQPLHGEGFGNIFEPLPLELHPVRGDATD